MRCSDNRWLFFKAMSDKNCQWNGPPPPETLTGAPPIAGGDPACRLQANSKEVLFR